MRKSTKPVLVRLTLLTAGHNPARKAMLGYSLSPAKVRVPTHFGLIEHPKEGPVLFDTGYATRFFEATREPPYQAYALMTPLEMSERENAVSQLRDLGHEPESVKWIILSHFDADHIGGLRDFPNAHVVCLRTAWEAVAGRTGLAALKVRLLPSLLPPDLPERLVLLDPPDGQDERPLGPTHDLFGDGSVRLISLPGHAEGHLGALVEAEGRGDGPGRGRRVICLCGDACFSVLQLPLTGPKPGLHRLLAHDRTQQDETYRLLVRLRRERPDITLMPSHCEEAARRYRTVR
jgi:glyoxylase-like metal-dependent hydrolase (beta-lactamase superfamily II)